MFYYQEALLILFFLLFVFLPHIVLWPGWHFVSRERSCWAWSKWSWDAVISGPKRCLLSIPDAASPSGLSSRPDICGAFNGLNSLVGFQGHLFRKTSEALIVGGVLPTWDLIGVFSTPSTRPFLRSHVRGLATPASVSHVSVETSHHYISAFRTQSVLCPASGPLLLL